MSRFDLGLLNSRVIIMFLVFLSVCLTILGVASYHVSSKALVEAKDVEMEQLLNIAIAFMNKELESVPFICDTITGSPEVQRYLSDGLAGQEVIDFIDYIAAQNDYIENVMITDATGKVNIVNIPDIVGLKIRDRDYFARSLAGETSISEILVSRITGNHVFIYAEPIFSPDFKGIAAIKLNFDKLLEESVAGISLGQTGYFWAIDKQGHTVLHPDPDIIHKINVFELKDDHELHAVAMRMIQGEQGSAVYQYNGIHRYATFAPAGNWHLAITIDMAEIMASIYSVRDVFVIAGSFFLLIAVLTIILVSKEQRLRMSEERYRLLIENANEAILVVQGGRNVFINPKAIQILGCGKRQIKSTPFMDFIYPRDRDAVRQRQLKHRCGENVQKNHSTRILAGDGSIKWIEINDVPIQWEKKTASLIFISDITGRKEAEEKIAAYTVELELKSVELEQLYRQLDEQIDKARFIHEKTLPYKIPLLDGISLAAHYQPALRLGGDYFNAVRTGNKLVLYLSDVSGHSMDGAMLSMFTKEAINSYISLKPAEIHPEKILYHLNRQYRRENYPDDYFICIFLAVLDLQTMELSYTSAGFQEVPLIQTGSGERMILASEGLPISGAIPEEIVCFMSEMITLTPGTTVFIATDGLAEHSVGDTRYGSKLKEVFHAHAHLPPEVIVRAINDDFSRFNNGSLQGYDDITIGIIQIDPAMKQVYHLELESNFAELTRLRQAVSPAVAGMASGEFFLAGLHELAANAIEHGNCFHQNKVVNIKVVITEAYMHAHIKDQGDGFNWQERMAKPLELSGYADRGRGIALLQTCSGLLYYNSKGNRIMFTVPSGKS